MLEPGRKISHYRVTEKIGQGGMGEVYRATDVRLERDVALKVLPEEFASSPDRIARFRREAQLLASLNHPNIASLFGMEEIDGTCWLVMELVEGPTLESRLEAGPLSQGEALDIARQIADALESAHAKGIIHRDLKPGNVKLGADGRVKVLDFGLAKALESDPGLSSSAIAHSPTRATAPTQAGVLLGTAPYMSPEQARGAGVDRRSDIWSFGCVLFEMLTGRRPFDAPTSSDAVAHVLLTEPDWTLLRGVSARTGRVVRRCLQKDARHRWHDIADTRIEIDEILAGGGEDAAHAPIPVPRPARWARAGWTLAALLLGVSGFLALKLGSGGSTPAPAMSLSLVVPAERALVLENHPSIAVSPDGRMVVFTALEPSGETSGGPRRSMLYRRPIDRFDSEPMTGTEGAFNPFFSPDGRFVGFFADAKLKKVPIEGGAPVSLCEAPYGFGARWIAGGSIVFAPHMSGGLHRVRESGGVSEPITVLRLEDDEVSHRWPEVLPDGETILFTVKTGSIASLDDASIVAQSLRDGTRHTLVEGGSFPRLAGSGSLVYARAGSLQVLPFDVRKAMVTGTPRAVIGDVVMNPYTGAAQFDLARAGTIAYVPGAPLLDLSTLVMVDSSGAEQILTNERYPFSDPRLSPDGDRLALWVSSANDKIWLFDLEQRMLTRLTSGSGNDYQPAWIGDGSHIVFLSDRDGTPDLFRLRVDGGEPEKLLEADTPEGGPLTWSPAGNVLMYVMSQPGTGSDLWSLPLDGDRRPRLFLGTTANESSPSFSPDGKWLAYASDESGRSEIYVQQWPGPGRKWRVSQDGGASPLWRDETLYYREGSRLMAVSVAAQPGFRIGTPRQVFDRRYEGGFDVTRDGAGFIMVRPEGERTAETQIRLILGEDTGPAALARRRGN